MLLIRLDAIGDALALVPLIAALRRRGMRVGAVLRAANAEVFSRRALDERYVATFALRSSAPQTQGHISTLARELSSAHYTHALIATEDPGGYRLARRTGIPNRVGFENGWGKPFKTLWVRRLCTQTVHRTAGLDPRAPHECEVLFSLAAQLLDAEVPTRDVSVLRPLVIDEEPRPDDRIGVQITDKWERLGAPLDAVVALARRIADKHAVRFIAARGEEEYAQRFIEAGGGDVEYCENVPSWKAAIASARALVAPDSGALHVAGMVGTPVVGVFPSENFVLQTARWSPWAAPHQSVKMEGEWPTVAADALEGLLSGKRAIYTG